MEEIILIHCELQGDGKSHSHAMLVTCWMFLLEVVLAKSDVNINITLISHF